MAFVFERVSERERASGGEASGETIISYTEMTIITFVVCCGTSRPRTSGKCARRLSLREVVMGKTVEKV